MNPTTAKFPGPRLTSALAGIVLLVSASAAQAGVILIDFNDLGPAPTLGGVWNVIPDPAGTTSLVDDTGAATNFTVSFDGSWFDSLHDSPWPHGDTIAWIDGGAARDGLNANPQTSGEALIFGGATADELYKIDLLAAEEFGDPANATADFSIGGGFGTGSQGHTGNDFNIHNFGLLNGEFLTWVVQADASGEIRLDIEGMDNFPGTSFLGDFVSAARITCLEQTDIGVFEVACPAAETPEPGTLALFGLGLAALGRARRKTRTG